MKPYHMESVQAYAERWRNLRAWGAPLPMLTKVEKYKGQNVLGWAYSGRCTAVIRCTGDMARDLATVLHELAHLAAPDSESHGPRWSTMFLRAAAEALECDVDCFDADVDLLDLDQQVIDAAQDWMESR